MRRTLCGLFFSVGLLTAPFAAAGPTVVELFTSQGCSSCPPADAMLMELADKDDLIVLSWHVDYWDYLGWKDDLADPSFTARQKSYAHAAGSRTVYTPQMVIGGRDHVIGSKPMRVMDKIQSHAAKSDPVEVTLTRDGDRLSIAARAKGIAGDAEVWIIRFRPLVVREIRHGENAGRTISYVNVVYSMTQTDPWEMSQPLQLDAILSGPEPVAVIVQAPQAGPIYGASRLP